MRDRGDVVVLCFAQVQKARQGHPARQPAREHLQVPPAQRAVVSP